MKVDNQHTSQFFDSLVDENTGSHVIRADPTKAVPEDPAESVTRTRGSHAQK